MSNYSERPMRLGYMIVSDPQPHLDKLLRSYCTGHILRPRRPDNNLVGRDSPLGIALEA